MKEIQRAARDDKALEVGMAACKRDTEKMMIRSITREQCLGTGQLDDVRIPILNLYASGPVSASASKARKLVKVISFIS